MQTEDRSSGRCAALHCWLVVRQAMTGGTTVGRYRKYTEADARLRLLKTSAPASTFEIIFDPPPKTEG